MKKLERLIDVLDRVVWIVLDVCVPFMLRIDRFVIKRYLNIETPLYKLWWEGHVKSMQRAIDRAANERKRIELGMIV